MNFWNKEQVTDYKVIDWLEEEIPELTKYQKECIRDNEIVRFAPFYFYKDIESSSTPLWRLSFIFYFPIFLILVIFLPINFLIRGKWGYSKMG